MIATYRIHHNRVTIEGNHLTWEAIEFSGDVFDRFEIIKHADGHREWIGLPATGKLLPVPEKIIRPE